MEEYFERDPELIYLNSANLSLCPQSVLSAMEEYRFKFEKNPTLELSNAWSKLWSAQKKLADFLGSRPEELILRTNTTQVLNLFLLGCPLPKKSEILIGELEYGSIANICRMRAEKEGFQLRTIQFPQSELSLKRLSKDSLLESIISQIGPNTRLILLSHMIASLGLILPIKELAEETQRRNILLVVDGAYAPGAMGLNFNELQNVDFYGASLYKWLMGPKGSAFGWIPNRHQEFLSPLSAGWTTFETGGPFADFGGGSRFQERFQLSGCQDFAPFIAIKDTIEFWERLGTEHIRNFLWTKSHFLEREIKTQLGWNRLKSDDQSLNGPILTYRMPESWQGRGSEMGLYLLRELKIQINTVRLNSGWHLIFSPHIYNGTEELVKAVSLINNLIRLTQ